MRRLKVVGLLMAIAFTVVACGGESSTGGEVETIAIGSLHPLTGPLATSGSQMDEAVAMAIEDINSAGGIEALDGAELEALSSDTQGDPATAQDEAQRLIGEDALALVGTYQSAATTNVARVAERSQVPLVIDVAVADEILQQGYRTRSGSSPTRRAWVPSGHAICARYLSRQGHRSRAFPIFTRARSSARASSGHSPPKPSSWASR